MINLRELSICYPDQLFLEIPETEQKQSWGKAQKYSNPNTQYQAYLNELCWNIFIPWLKSWLEEENESKTPNFLNYYYPEIWEFVNGSTIILRDLKLALIPIEGCDIEEIDIPQEWVDISQWKADYYLVIHINLDILEQSWMRIRGYISYDQLKNRGEYELKERFYYLSEEYLTKDISNLFLNLQTKAINDPKLDSCPKLSPEVVTKLFNNIGNASIYHPRLEIPFQQWQILLTNPEWVKELYRKRTNLAKLSIPLSQGINLRNWLYNIAETTVESWQLLDSLITPTEAISIRGGKKKIAVTKESIIPLIELLQPHNSEKVRSQAAGVLGKIGAGYPEISQALIELLNTAKDEETRWEAALSLGKIDMQNPLAGIAKGKIIDLGLQLKGQKIILIVAIIPKDKKKISIWLQLKPMCQLTKLPPNLQLKVLSEGNTILEAESRSCPNGQGKDECIQLRFTPPSKTCFQVKITLHNASFIENFIV